MGRVLALFAALIAAVAIAWAGAQPPKPAPLSAPADGFSAERAMADVTAIASVPHAIGTDANHAARNRLTVRMAALGLDPQVHAGEGVYSRGRGAALSIAGGHVENLVGVLPGRDRAAPALAVMAHYDSVPASPGAADDAAGAASALEIVRALKARGAPARDVIVLLTDGEEAGLLGADAFFNRDPLAKRVGFVINMEARGAAGRALMFQTGERNGGTVEMLRRTAPNPWASSLIDYIYAHMPNDTDFTISRKAGIAGLNYAFMGHQFEYHSPTSTPATLDPGTLQDMGGQALASAQAVAFAPTLPAKTPDLLYSQLLGGITLAYPPTLGWLILLASAGLMLLAVRRAWRIEAFAWTDILRGFGAGLFAVVGGCAVLHFARLATGARFGFLEQRFLLAQADRWEAAVMLLAVGFLIFAAAELARGRRFIALLPLGAGIGSCLLAALAHDGLDKVGLGLGVVAALLALASYGRPVSRAGAWAGVLVLGLIIAVAVQATAPVAAFVFAWPLLLAAIMAAATSFSARRGAPALLALALPAALGLAWVGGYAHTVYLALDMAELIGAPVLMAALLLWPLAQPEEGAPPARLVGPAILLCGLAVLAAVRVVDPYDARHPQVAAVGYQVDQDSGRAWRFASSPGHNSWTDAVLRADGGKVAELSHWSFGSAPVEAAPAHPVQEAAPDITLSKQADGTVRLHAVPPPGARVLLLRLTPDTPMTLEQLAGVGLHLPLKPGAGSMVRWAAAPGGIDLILRPGGPGKLEVGYGATLERWPAGVTPLPSRPANLMAFGESDSTFVVGTRRFSW